MSLLLLLIVVPCVRVNAWAMQLTNHQCDEQRSLHRSTGWQLTCGIDSLVMRPPSSRPICENVWVGISDHPGCMAVIVLQSAVYTSLPFIRSCELPSIGMVRLEPSTSISFAFPGEGLHTSSEMEPNIKPESNTVFTLLQCAKQHIALTSLQ